MSPRITYFLVILAVFGYGRVSADSGRPNDGPCENNGELLPHKSDCGKFYKCDHNELIPYDCPSGLHWNDEKKYCDWPENANCVLLTTASPSRCDVSAPPPSCPEHDPDGLAVHLPHQYDCKKFYKCDWGVRYEFDCPSKLHFNPKLEVCDWPKDAGCECGEEATLPPDVGSGDGPESCDPAAPVPTCPEHDPLEPSVQLPHQNDCTKFYKCDWGSAFLFDCPAGLHFNPKLQLCDWPKDAGCKCAGDVTTPSPDQSTTDDEGSGDGVESCDPAAPIPTCPEHDPNADAVYLPHQYDCTKFYECDWGIPFLFDCPAGLHFNPMLSVCDWPKDAGCKCSGQEVTTQTPPDSTTDGGSGDGGSGDIPEFCDASSPPPGCSLHRGDLFYLPHQYDCSKFYKCELGQRSLLHCAPGLLYSTEIQLCDWPENVHCKCTLV